MIPKYEIIKSISDVGIIAVIRAETSVKAKNIANACIKGGINAIEVTFTVPRAHVVIEELRNAFVERELLIGAGTVLDSETARISILSGAQYIVSPTFDLATCKLCNRYQIPYMPGCLTPNEIITALEAGADVIKVFPGSNVGPSFIKAIKGPLPQVPLIPTGGVDLENVDQWIKNGCIAVGVGGKLTEGAKTQDYDRITAVARDFVNRIKQARIN